MTNELEPCPFCGKRPLENNEFGTYRITCTDDDCPACNDNWFETKEEAIKVWNTRYKRTCHIIIKPSDSDYSEDWHFMCSECGCLIGVDEVERKADAIPVPVRYANFCANCGSYVCGAEVVDG